MGDNRFVRVYSAGGVKSHAYIRVGGADVEAYCRINRIRRVPRPFTNTSVYRDHASPIPEGYDLIEARRLLSVEGCSVTSAAFGVGYESPAQFSREYARKFGTFPRNDCLTIRRAAEGERL